MITLKLWDKKIPLIYPNGVVAAPEQVFKDYPFTQYAPTVLEIMQEIDAGVFVGAIDNLLILRQIYNVEQSLDDGQAIAAIEEIRNAPQEIPASAEERIAAALEFQAMLALPDNM